MSDQEEHTRYEDFISTLNHLVETSASSDLGVRVAVSGTRDYDDRGDVGYRFHVDAHIHGSPSVSGHLRYTDASHRVHTPEDGPFSLEAEVKDFARILSGTLPSFKLQTEGTTLTYGKTSTLRRVAGE